MVWYLYLSEAPDSHLDTACRDTPSRSASSSCDQPPRLRSMVILSAMIILKSSFPPFQAGFYPLILANDSVDSHQEDSTLCQPAVATAKNRLSFRLRRDFPPFPIIQTDFSNSRLYAGVSLCSVEWARAKSFSVKPFFKKACGGPGGKAPWRDARAEPLPGSRGSASASVTASHT